jgi:hypothetical protein
MSNVCEVCGSDKNVINSKKYNKVFCSRHYSQMKTQGKIIERTRYDPNKIIVNTNENCAEIELYDNNCNVVAKAIIDIDDVEKVKKYKWRLNTRGYVTSTKYDNKGMSLHRFLLNLNDPNILVDHKSCNKLDNRKNNLRQCDSSQNSMNRSHQSNNISGFPGVGWNKKMNKWKSYITVERKRIHLGYFNDFNEAVKIRKKAMRKHFGEFSYDNSLKIASQ